MKLLPVEGAAQGLPGPAQGMAVGSGPWHSKAGVSATLGVLQPAQGLLEHS